MLKNDVKVEKTLFQFAHTRKTLYFCIVFFIVLDLRLTRLEQGVAPFFIPQPLLSLFFSSESERCADVIITVLGVAYHISAIEIDVPSFAFTMFG